MFRSLLIFAGTVSLLLGILGIFLPMLPTTPFLLLTAYCYSRSSKRFYQWLVSNRWFGEYLRNYREGRGIPMRNKILTLALLWLTIGSTTLFVLSAWWGRLILLGIATAVTIHILRIKTYRAPDATRASEKVIWSEKPGLDSQ